MNNHETRDWILLSQLEKHPQNEWKQSKIIEKYQLIEIKNHLYLYSMRRASEHQVI